MHVYIASHRCRFEEDSAHLYVTLIEHMKRIDSATLSVSFVHITAFSEDLATVIKDDYLRYGCMGVWMYGMYVRMYGLC